VHHLNRREFVKKSLKMGAAVATGGIMSDGLAKRINPIEVFIPLPIQVVIDDVGWWSGRDGHLKQEPYRTGINRDHVPADYQAIVDLGKALNIRPQAAMILCEWDTQNILRRIPTSTWMGANWDNSKWVGPHLEEAADIIRNNKQHFELTMHGVGHEYWTNGVMTRAEWADKNGIMRPQDEVEAHLDLYSELLKQHQLDPLPTSFVPTAFLHHFGISKGHTVSMAQMLKNRGINYINTPFEDMFNRDKVQYELFGFDAGVMTVDRGRDLLAWKSIGTMAHGDLKGPTCGLHWPNLLHPDPLQNNKIVAGWVDLLKPYQTKKETLLATDSDQFLRQLAYHKCTDFAVKEGQIQLDFSEVDKLPVHFELDHFCIKINSAVNLEFKSKKLHIDQVKIEQQGDSIQYRIELNRKTDQNMAVLEYASDR
jgi:hypothetical protein